MVAMRPTKNSKCFQFVGIGICWQKYIKVHVSTLYYEATATGGLVFCVIRFFKIFLFTIEIHCSFNDDFSDKNIDYTFSHSNCITRNSWMCAEMSSFIYPNQLYFSQGSQVNRNPFYDSSQLDSSILHQIKIKSVCHILFGAWCLSIEKAIWGRSNFTMLWNVMKCALEQTSADLQEEVAFPSCHVLYVPQRSLWLISRTFYMSHRAVAPGISTPLGGLRPAPNECQHRSENCVMWLQTRVYI